MSYVLDAKREVETAIEELVEKAKGDQQTASNLNDISVSLAHVLNEAMRGLQFEDIASQSMSHNIDILNTLTPIAKAMEQKLASLQSINDALVSAVRLYQEQLGSRKQKQVAASSMQSGAIDLF